MTRLTTLAPLDPGEMDALAEVERAPRRLASRRELWAEGALITQRWILASGWACRTRTLHDGRRQILGLVLPGELLGFCRYARPLALTSVTALTELVLCPAPAAVERHPDEGLAAAYAISSALDEVYLLQHVTRLGRMSAQERVLDWLLETRDRLMLSGAATRAEFEMPITQEGLADILGLTAVHVNRTIQALRRDGLIGLGRGHVTFPSPARVEDAVAYKSALAMLRGAEDGR